MGDVDTNKPDQSAPDSSSNDTGEASTMTVDMLDPSHQSPFVKLPADVLFEILVLAGSPEYVLSIMRTCKTMFSVLFHPDAQWVWKETRKRVSYNFGPSSPLPSEFSGWGTTSFTLPEPRALSFARRLVCGKTTRCMYRSYAMRFRICKDPACLRKATNKLASDPLDQRISTLICYEEAPNCFAKDRAANVSHAKLHYRRDHHETITRYYRDIVSKPDAQTVRASQFSKCFCTKVYRWKEARHIVAKRIREANRTKASNYAITYGWDKSYFSDCPTFHSYSQWKSQVFEELNDRDIIWMKDAIESELIASAEKRARRANEATGMRNRADIEALYNTLRSKPTNHIFPPLSVFRKLPVVGLLQSTHPPEATKPSTPWYLLQKDAKKPHGEKELLKALDGNKMISKMIDTQVKDWINQARDDLAVVLGFPKGWKSASSLVVHPVDRLTARWICIKCAPLNGEGYANKWRIDESLDFEGVCKHECGKDGLNVQGRKAKNNQKIEWKASNFQRDEKVIQVMETWLQKKQLREDMTRTTEMLFTGGYAVICKSCDPPMVLDCRNMIAHAHRHDSMEIEANPGVHELNLFLGGFRYKYAWAGALLGPSSHSKTVQADIQKKIYGCRHCMRKKQVQDVKFMERLNAGSPPEPLVMKAVPVKNVVLSQIGRDGEGRPFVLIQWTEIAYESQAFYSKRT
ncbi:hypothetical protein BJ165DRAFT_1449516 [Panaeolus papilionaceus]|nr:hypothetical protein BJ165DRAFT_1449516 [Panaeolus papilionaceus]